MHWQLQVERSAETLKLVPLPVAVRLVLLAREVTHNSNIKLKGLGAPSLRSGCHAGQCIQVICHWQVPLPLAVALTAVRAGSLPVSVPVLEL